MSVRWGQAVSFSLVWLAYCATYFLRKPLGVIKSDLGTDLGLSKTELGWCDLALTLPYGVLQILVPCLASGHGPRHLAGILWAPGLQPPRGLSRPQSHWLPPGPSLARLLRPGPPLVP